MTREEFDRELRRLPLVVIVNVILVIAVCVTPGLLYYAAHWVFYGGRLLCD